MTELLNRNLLGMDPKAPSRFNDLAKETEGCILLTAGEPDFGISDVVKTNVTRALNNGLTHYAASNGDTRIRMAAADFEKRTKGMTYAADEVIMTTGSTEAVFLALLGILNPGDEVVRQAPVLRLKETLEEVAELARHALRRGVLPGGGGGEQVLPHFRVHGGLHGEVEIDGAVIVLDPEVRLPLARERVHHARHLLGEEPQMQGVPAVEVEEAGRRLRLRERFSGALDADALHKALRLDGLVVHVDQLVLEGRRAGIDDKNFHGYLLQYRIQLGWPENAYCLMQGIITHIN